MTISVYVPRETVAVSLGADDIAKRLDTLDNVNVIRNGSWGASWLEPMLEVVVEDQRIAYGPVLPDKVDDLLEAGFLEGGEHLVSDRNQGCFHLLGRKWMINITHARRVRRSRF